MCPLDMKSIIGAATVVGCLQHGAGVCDEQFTGSPLLVEQTFFFGRCCARRNNSGSHEYMLN